MSVHISKEFYIPFLPPCSVMTFSHYYFLYLSCFDIFTDFEIKQFFECTEVEFGSLSDDVIKAYVGTEEPL